MFLGTVVNVVCVVLGGMIGILAKKGIPSRFADLLMNGIGLVTLSIGMSFAIKSENILIVVLSIVLGGIVGEWIDLDAQLEKGATFVRSKMKGDGNQVAEGMIAATLLFCVGSMAIMGSLDSGLRGDHSILFTKAIMDGIAAALFASTMGVGVILSAIPLFIYQGFITLSASLLEPVLTAAVITELSAVGGVLLLGLSLSILEIKKIKVVNLLPALLFAVLITTLMG